MKKVNIICKDTGFGLSKCFWVLHGIFLVSGFQVTSSTPRYDGDISAFIQNLCYVFASSCLPSRQSRKYDLNLFVEDIDPGYFAQADVNCFMPNQEWFRYRWLAYLPGIDRILAKTQLAKQLFTSLNCSTDYVGFTSQDCFQADVPKDYGLFFHLAGNSPYKGTETILKLWERHPEWPTLVVVQSAKQARMTCAPNIQHHVGYLEESILRTYQNRCGVHLCPSETEGFGHYIVEAMSCQALVVTTDAPPMNELVTAQRGLLVDYHQTQSNPLSTRYFVDPQKLEHCIQAILAMSNTQKRVLGQQARDWYEQNDQGFKAALANCLGEMLKS